ncbi:MAG TPA: helix-turn-helix transcriptional regulator [Mucilaginibacter sp.]|jgi:transcriptional regulator with XRE-family HTH domain
MNKVLYAARKAKGITEAQLAKLLQIDESTFKELECSLVDISAKLALKLSKLFDIEPELFMFNEGQNTRILKTAMDEVAGILLASSFDKAPPSYYFSLISLGNKALMIQSELNHALYKQFELEKDNEAIRTLYYDLVEQLKEKIEA